MARVGTVAYQLQLPNGARIHDMFLVGLLKKYCGEEPEEVSKSHLTRGRIEILVRQAGQPAANATWIELTEFKQLYLSSKLMDELVVQRGGADVMCGIQYSHRIRKGANKISIAEGKQSGLRQG
jgi:hypothetical protein